MPHRRIDRRPIRPFQATEQKRDLLDGLVMAAPNSLEEDAHRVIAFNHRDRIGRFDHGCPVTPSCARASRGFLLRAPAAIAASGREACRIEGTLAFFKDWRNLMSV